jgi:hypothetical protein
MKLLPFTSMGASGHSLCASSLKGLRNSRLLILLLATWSAVPSARAQQEFTVEQLDQWVFQQHGNSQGARQALNSELLMRIENLERTTKLSPAQKEKLQLLGKGDIQHFFDRYGAFKEKFRGLRLKQTDADFQQKWQNLWQEINPLQMTLQAGLFKNDSLFEKSLTSTLTAEQLQRRAAVDKERQEFRKRGKVAVGVALFEQSLPLREEQRRQLTDLLLSETQAQQWQGNTAAIHVLVTLSRISEAKVKPLFDDAQWQAVKQEMGQFRRRGPGPAIFIDPE